MGAIFRSENIGGRCPSAEGRVQSARVARGVAKRSSLWARVAFGGVLTHAHPRWRVGGALGVLGTVERGEEDIAVVVFNFCAEVVNRCVGGGELKKVVTQEVGVG